MEVEAVHAANQNKSESSLRAPLPVDKVVFCFNICSFKIKCVSLRRGDIDFAHVLQKLKVAIIKGTMSAFNIFEMWNGYYGHIYLLGVNVFRREAGVIFPRIRPSARARQKAVEAVGCGVNSEVDVVYRSQLRGVSKRMLHLLQSLCTSAGWQRCCLKRALSAGKSRICIAFELSLPEFA